MYNFYRINVLIVKKKNGETYRVFQYLYIMYFIYFMYNKNLLLKYSIVISYYNGLADIIIVIIGYVCIKPSKWTQ